MNCPKCGKKAKRIQGGYTKTEVLRYCMCPECCYMFRSLEVIQGSVDADIDLRKSHVIKTEPLTRTTVRYRIMPGTLVKFETLESEVKLWQEPFQLVRLTEKKDVQSWNLKNELQSS